MDILITRPDHDDTVTYLSLWAGEIVKRAKCSGNVFDYAGKKANKKEIEKLLKKRNPRFVFFNGHGNEKTIFGQGDQPLIKEGENEELLASKIVYSRACNSAKSLGKSACENGADAYIGYKGEFTFFTDTSSECTPLRDKFAEPFFKSSNEIAESLIKGNTVSEAYDKSQATFDKWIGKFSSSGAPVGSETIIWALYADKENQIFHGNKGAAL